IRFSMKYGNDDPAMLNARLDWMILAGRYREALEYIEKIGAEKFASANTDDYWSGFPLNAESIKLRGAMLMYLAGDSRNAARALEHLKDMEGTSIGGASARYFARLRLAQILLEENPELAHKIAEDVTYVAQAEGWYVLEYYATIIDGWADYFQKEYYKALINFIKARGILQGDNRQYAVTYAHQLGLLAVRNKMSPRGNYDALIKIVSDELEQHPYNRAIFTLRDWAPVSAGPEFFLSESIQNLHARGQHWDALNLLLKHARRQEFYFEPGRNPGGVRGFVTAVQWGRELNSFSYIPALFGRYSIHTQSVTAARDALPAHVPLTPQVFPDTASYLFSFPMQGQRKLYLVYPGTSGGRRTNFMYTMNVTGEQLSGMERSCSYDNARGCAPYQELFRDLQAKLGAPTRPLYIQYAPEFDIHYERLLFPSGTLRPVMYFYHPEMSANAGRVTRREVYLPQGCNIPATISAANRVGDFENTMLEGGSTAGGAWVWPAGVDARLSSSGQERPVYLRRFVCGASQLRLWDLDRFAARPGPEAVMYTNRINESNLDRAFARHFADTGTTLIELHGGTGAQFADNLLTALRGDGRGHVRIQDAFITIHKNAGGASGLRLILPAIPTQ
ncbi:MAG: hypothetical protein KDK34_11730, partial [Leptospiraceae bacterium]|nr:hypothetical protein [Leptospiraceae bacterium]